MQIIRVLLADDHKVVRDGLQSLLSESDDIEVVGQAADGLEAVGLARQLQPDVVVMDIGMPHLNGIEATRRVVKEVGSAKVLILSQYEGDHHVLDAVEAGAKGYLTKRGAGVDLVEGVRALARGDAVLHPAAARVLIAEYLQCSVERCADSFQRLTDREKEVLILVAEGYTNQQMAETMHVSPKTVDGHRTSLMGKLGLHNKTEVVKYALRRQLIDL